MQENFKQLGAETPLREFTPQNPYILLVYFWITKKTAHKIYIHLFWTLKHSFQNTKLNYDLGWIILPFLFNNECIFVLCVYNTRLVTGFYCSQLQALGDGTRFVLFNFFWLVIFCCRLYKCFRKYFCHVHSVIASTYVRFHLDLLYLCVQFVYLCCFIVSMML